MYASYQNQGTREYMEDTIDIKERFFEDLDYYAIFDGHGGDFVSKYLKTHFLHVLSSYIYQYQKDVIRALIQTFNHIAELLEKDERSLYMGSTALILIKNSQKIWLANVGDCRAVLKYFSSNSYRSTQLTSDHKPNNSYEMQRIRDLSGFVTKDAFGTWRVGGSLAVSRSFGDRYLHPWVTWRPEIHVYDVHEDMRAIILASDGIWDTLSNADVVTISEHVINAGLFYDQNNVLENVTREIARQAQQRGSGDNISVLFIII